MQFPTEKEPWLQMMSQIREGTAIDANGIEVVDFSDEHIELSMTIEAKHRQPMGLMHGGISMLLAETAASFHACWGVDLTKVNPVGLEINGSHLRSAREGTVRVIGKVVRRSRNFIVHQVDIFHVETDKQLTTARVTNYYKPVG
ncbi:MAG: PaaI family thioesterase [Chloroflexi bacterium]|nr:MAG: PaaI family thioesterase [Chloroflexota bacterium]MBL1194640.1 PaaI family thioesterase [Chloroflexota bacterium]NOH11930.1 PaaI family thioesterase [Chloroflexota bacterium]